MAKIWAALLSDRLVVSTGETMAVIGGANTGRKPFLLAITDVKDKSVAESLDKSIARKDDGPLDDQVAGCHILCLRGCKCGRHVAVSNSRKQLVVIELPRQDEDGNDSSRIIFSAVLQRNALCLAFIGDCGRVLVADKSGDVIAYDLTSGNRVLLFGHLAIILDMVISADDTHVITCDRDEKIKTTSYPNTYNIQSFCMGHSEYVIGIGITSQNKDILYSASGDGTIRLWKYKSGKCLQIVYCKDYLSDEMVSLCAELQRSFERGSTLKACESDGGQSTTTTTSRSLARGLVVPIKNVIISKHDVIAVIFHGLPVISLFRVVRDDVDDAVSSLHVQNLPLKSEPWDVCFDGGGNLFLLCSGDEKAPFATGFQLKDDKFIPLKGDSKAASLLQNVADVWPALKVSSDVPSVIPTLFKQSFDNVTDYYEAKERRTKLRSIITSAQKKKRQKV